MWTLWSKVRLYKRPASEIMDLTAWCEQITGLPGPDELTAYCLDSAVESFGGWIEGKLNKFDRKGNPIYKLEDLLLDQKGKRRIRSSNADSIMGVMGGQLVTLDTLLADPQYIAQVEAGLVAPPPGWEERKQKAV
jgi:hypothetical protein